MSTGVTLRKSPGASLGPTISDYLFCEYEDVGQLCCQRPLWLYVCTHCKERISFYLNVF